MTSDRRIQRPRPSSQRGSDDLGFPVEGDPAGFARAFVAVTRRQATFTSHAPPRLDFQDIDDLGLPREGNAGDFASAFSALRDRWPLGTPTGGKFSRAVNRRQLGLSCLLGLAAIRQFQTHQRRPMHGGRWSSETAPVAPRAAPTGSRHQLAPDGSATASEYTCSTYYEHT
jgi:hypothetical protein